ncbi:alpha/beta hydrolase [Nocardioides pacificus]
MAISRRALLLGGTGTAVLAAGAGAGVLVEYDVLPGRTRAHELLGLNGEAGEIPDVEPGPRVSGTLRSRHVPGGADWTVAYPPGSAEDDRLPVVLALHGADMRAETLFANLGVDRFLADAQARFAVAAIDGGQAYWHERDDGRDVGAMVLEEFVPLLAERGLDVERPAFWGWSMGGFGAMLLAARRQAAGQEVGPVLAVSPAIWDSAEQANERAFDGEEDYRSCMELVEADDRTRTRVDCGTGDPFYRNVVDFCDREDVEAHFDAGGHDAAYWTRMIPAQLAWLQKQVTPTT